MTAPPPNRFPITHLVVHCSAEKHGAKTTAQDIDRWHRQRGFLRIGYHYVIRTDGTIETGRPLDQAGAHVEGHNRSTIGICLVGGLDPKTGEPSGAFSEAQFYSLKGLLLALQSDHPDAEVLGHRDFPNVRKDCPCFDVRTWWDQAFNDTKDSSSSE